MKLEYLAIDGYKSLKHLEIHFQKQSSATAIDFLIGRNGSGKSSVLEAVGLIFTRIMHNETPGFGFELKYRMSDGAQIQVCPQPEKRKQEGYRQRLFVRIRKDGQEKIADRIPGEYLPDRIVSYCSGANASMEEILVQSPREALISDLYDQMKLGEEADAEQIRAIQNDYKGFDNHPRVLSLDAVTAKIVLPVLFAVLPFEKQDLRRELKKYSRLRRMLTKRLNVDLIPVAFSFCVRDDFLEQTAELPQIGVLRELLTASGSKRESYADDISNVIQADRMTEDGSPAAATRAVFLYRTAEEEKNGWYHPGLQEFFAGNPFTLLSVLLTAYRMGVISEIHFTYRDGKKPGLFEMDALSDGERMWLARMGLVLLAQKYCGENTLFLYDEPDVHFNDDWNRSFIQLLYQLGEKRQHQFLVATHSTLILTDAFYEQLHLFTHDSKRGTAVVSEIEISTFAAQRDEISRQVFKTETIGAYAENAVQRMMGKKNPQKLITDIEKLGPGYRRFRMYEQLYGLLDEKLE